MKFLIAYNDNTEDLAGGFFACCGEEIIEETENRHIDSVVLTPPSLTNTFLSSIFLTVKSVLLLIMEMLEALMVIMET